MEAITEYGLVPPVPMDVPRDHRRRQLCGHGRGKFQASKPPKKDNYL